MLHHQVCKFINHEHHVWQFLGNACPFSVALRLHPDAQFVFAKLVVALDVLDAGVLQELVALFHLADGPLNDSSSLGHISDHGHHQVGDLAELRHFHHLWIDQAELQFIWSLGVEPTHDDGVHAHALAAAGGAGDQHVRLLGEVQDQRLARRVLSKEHWQSHAGSGWTTHQFLQAHLFALWIRYFNANCAAADEVVDDANVRCLQLACQVIGHGLQAGCAGALSKFHVVQRDHWTAFDLLDLAFNVVLAQGSGELGGLLAHERFHLG